MKVKGNKVVVVTRMHVKPEQEKDFVATIRNMLEATRVRPGCVYYWLTVDADTPLTYCLVEEWEDKAALDKYITSTAYRRLLGLMDLLDAPPVVRFHTVVSTSGLEYVSEVFNSSIRSGT